MGKIIVSTFISLDGIANTPDQWSDGFWNHETEKFKNDELEATSAMLLGRKTFEYFADYWPGATGDFADRFNALPKLVASHTLKSVSAWDGSELLSNPISNSITKAKLSVRGPIFVHGSLNLAQSLSKLGLVDEYHLLVYPIILGDGSRLFGENQKNRLELISSEAFSTGVLALKYRTNAAS